MQPVSTPFLFVAATPAPVIKYLWRMVYVRRILSHAEYDGKDWLK